MNNNNRQSSISRNDHKRYQISTVLLKSKSKLQTPSTFLQLNNNNNTSLSKTIKKNSLQKNNTTNNIWNRTCASLSKESYEDERKKNR